LFACSSGGGQERKRANAKSSTAKTDNCSTSSTPTPTTTTKTDTTTSTSQTTTAEDDDTTPITAGLLLADVPYSTISSVMASKCAYSGCHAAGGMSPDLSTEALAKVSAADISELVQSTTKPMPPASVATAKQLSVSERDNIVAWAKGVTAGGGATTTSTSTTSTTGSGSTSSTSTSNCTTGTGTTGGAGGPGGTATDEKEDTLVISEAFKVIMEPEDLKTCQAQGKLYDWKNERCDTAAYSAGTCNRALLIKSYPNNSTVNEAADSWDANKWRYNQCGTENGKLVVWMICPTADGTTCLSDEAIASGSQAGSAVVKYARLPAAN
jgi:hypothetical protein